MKRYGIRWAGPEQPICEPMPDGYWTPWHEAQSEVADALAAIETARREGYEQGLDTGKWSEREKVLNELRGVRDDERQMMSLRNAAKWAIGLIHDNLPTQPTGRDMTHELKTDPEVFQAVWDEKKNFEIRKDDRGFSVGDTLVLRETVSTGAEMASGAPLDYTGREVAVLVSYILRGPIYGLHDGWVIMSFFLTAATETGDENG